MAASPDSTVVVALSNSEQIRARISELQRALQQQLPGYESLLHTIHRNLANDPDTVQILSEQEIGVICAALSKRTGVFIAAQEAEKMAKKGKKGEKVNVDEL